MRKSLRHVVVWALAVAALGCSQKQNPDVGELERLREEKARLEAELEQLRAENRRLRGQPDTPSAVAQYFTNDARAGTLAGLAPGDLVDKARQAFGRETRMNVSTSGGRRESRYEWELVGGVTLRLGADDSGQLFSIGVVIDTSQPPVIPTVEGITIGRDTFEMIDRKFGQALWTNLHIWGVRDTYTVAQTLSPGPERRWQLQFAYEMPPGVPAEELERIRIEVGQHRNANYLMQYVGDRIPYLVRLEEPR